MPTAATTTASSDQNRLKLPTRLHDEAKKMADYFYANFYLTTSGNFRVQALMNAMFEIGADRIMFSVDYPFESCADAATWFDAAAISEPDRVKIGRTNALKLFRLRY